MKRKKMIIGTSSIFVLLIIVLLGGSQYMLNYSLRPENRGKNLESSWQYMFKTYPYLKPWIDSLKQNQALKDTFIYSPDHVKLHAYYVASSRPTAKTAVIVHGYTDNAIRMMMIGYLYNKKTGFQHPPTRFTRHWPERWKCHTNGMVRPQRCNTMDGGCQSNLR